MAFGVLELGVTLVRLSDRNLGRPPFQTSVVMTQGGGCVPEPGTIKVGRMTTSLFHGLRVP